MITVNAGLMSTTIRSVGIWQATGVGPSNVWMRVASRTQRLEKPTFVALDALSSIVLVAEHSLDCAVHLAGNMEIA